MLSCIIYTIIKNLCVFWLSIFSIKTLSEIIDGYKEGSKHGDKSFNRLLGIGIPYLLMKLMSCHGFSKNINSVVILKFPKKMLTYNFSEIFTILECNVHHLEKPTNEVKQRIRAEKEIIQKKSWHV